MKLVPSTWAGEILVREDQFENDNGTAHEVLVRNTYLIHDLPFPIKTCIDVGAHIGCFTAALRRRYRDVIVICMEPVEENLQVLRANLDRIFADRPKEPWYAGRYGAYGNPMYYSEAPLYLHSCVKPGGSSTVASYVGPYAGHHPCDFKSEFLPPKEVEPMTVEQVLDSIFEKELDLLKLDCEGAEVNILAHASIERIGVILGEWHSWSQLEPVIKERFPGDKWILDIWGNEGDGRGMFRLSQRKWWNR